MDSKPAILEASLQQALQTLEVQAGVDHRSELEDLLFASYRRGRITLFLAHHPDLSVASYVARVAGYYQRLHPYLHQLQIEKDDQVWAPLTNRMECWACTFLLKKGFDYSKARELAKDFCAYAGAALVNAFFPYDIDFDPWAVVLVQNICRKHLRDDGRKAKQVSRELSVDEDWFSRQIDSAATTGTQRVDHQYDLQRAFAILSPEEANVLALYYYQNLKPVEIAQVLGKRPSEIYVIKFSALTHLRKVLEAGGYKG